MSIMHFGSTANLSSSSPSFGDGFYSLFVINSINVGSTRTSRTVTEILGTEPSNNSFGSAFSENSFVLGDKIYIEYKIDNIIDNTIYAIGFQPENSENPSVECGSFDGSLGLYANSNSQENAEALIVGGSFAFVNGDVVGVLIDYHGKNGGAVLTYYLNDIEQSANMDTSLVLISMPQENYFRIASTLGASTDTNAKLTCGFVTGDMTYPAKIASGFIAIDDLVRPRNLQWVNSYTTITDTTESNSQTASVRIEINTDGTYNVIRSIGFDFLGTWRKDGLIDTTNYEYQIIYNETQSDGNIIALGGAVITADQGSTIYNTLDSDGLGIRYTVSHTAGLNKFESGFINISVREIADINNRTGTMYTNIISNADDF